MPRQLAKWVLEYNRISVIFDSNSALSYGNEAKSSRADLFAREFATSMASWGGRESGEGRR